MFALRPLHRVGLRLAVSASFAITASTASASLTTPSRCLHQTPLRHFDIKKHEMEKRRLREMEKAGIDPEDDEPWVAPEEQQRIDEEEAQRLADLEEQRQEMLKKRAEEDVIKRKKFKEFRAKQIAMSRQRKEDAATAKEAPRHHANSGSEGDEGVSQEGGEPADSGATDGFSDLKNHIRTGVVYHTLKEMVAVRAKVGSRSFIRQKALAKGKKIVKIDCSVPAADGIFSEDIVSAFEQYFQENTKLNGCKGKLSEKVRIAMKENVLTVSTTMAYRKKYFKYLTKKFLKKKDLREWIRILSTGKDTYQLKYYNIQAPEDE